MQRKRHPLLTWQLTGACGGGGGPWWTEGRQDRAGTGWAVGEVDRGRPWCLPFMEFDQFLIKIQIIKFKRTKAPFSSTDETKKNDNTLFGE